MIVSGEQQRDSVIHIHISFLPKLPSHPGCRITLSREVYFFFFFIRLYLFIFGHTGSSLLCGLSLVVEGGDYSLVAVHGLLIGVASLLAEHVL